VRTSVVDDYRDEIVYLEVDGLLDLSAASPPSPNAAD